MVALKTLLTSVLRSFQITPTLLKKRTNSGKKKRLLLVLPNLGVISLQTRTKLQVFKGVAG